MPSILTLYLQESASYHLKKLYTLVQLTACITYKGMDLAKSCLVLFSRVVESLLCSLHEHPVLRCKSYLLEL